MNPKIQYVISGLAFLVLPMAIYNSIKIQHLQRKIDELKLSKSIEEKLNQ